MAKEGFPFVLVPLLLALIFAYLQLWVVAAVFVLLAAFMAFFFRDPERTIVDEKGVIVSAADGRVTRIDVSESEKVVSVFLSPLDVHINRSPISGTITKVEYTKGRKGPATGNQASFLNERNSLTITGDHVSVVCTQIAGILARRIVCWAKEGDELEIGQRFGLIKFGSRTDLRMPANVEIMVSLGDKVVGGKTIIARVKGPH